MKIRKKMTEKMPPIMLPLTKEITIMTPDKISIPMSDVLIKNSGMHIIIGRQKPVKTIAIAPRMKAA
jgi:hypothetical protein